MQKNDRDPINCFREYCKGFSRLVIYGAGDVGNMVAEYMERKGMLYDSFCVTAKPEKHSFRGHVVKEISEVLEPGTDTGIIVAVSRKYVDGILSLLENRSRQYFYRTDFLFRLFEERCREASLKVMTENGYITGVLEAVFDRNTMYICCPASIGDTLYVAAFARAYKKENLSVQRVCLILKKGHEELGTLFSSVDQVLVSDEIVEILDYYSLYTQTWRLKNYIYGHFKKNLHFEYDKEYFLENSILSRYRRLILNLPEAAELEQAVLNRESSKPKDRKQDVVIMPYARTAKLLPLSFWEELVRRLKQKGYTVFTNVGGEKEKPVTGTKPLRESLLNTAALCGDFRAVISLRSGLSDLLGFTGVKLVVINTSEELYREWNLKDVFGREEIYNMNCFEDRDQDEEIEEIMRIIG